MYQICIVSILQFRLSGPFNRVVARPATDFVTKYLCVFENIALASSRRSLGIHSGFWPVFMTGHVNVRDLVNQGITQQQQQRRSVPAFTRKCRGSHPLPKINIFRTRILITSPLLSIPDFLPVSCTRCHQMNSAWVAGRREIHLCTSQMVCVT